MRNVTTFLKYISSEINISSPLAPNHHAAATVKWLQSCPTLCDLIDGSPLGSSVPGILQSRTLEWVAISFSNAWKVKSESEVAQLCPIPSDPMDCSPPGSSIHGIFQARVLEWGAIAFSCHGTLLTNKKESVDIGTTWRNLLRIILSEKGKSRVI